MEIEGMQDCEMCHNAMDKQELDDNDMCPSCANDYYYCGECGDAIHTDDYDMGNEMCYDCVRDNDLQETLVVRLGQNY